MFLPAAAGKPPETLTTSIEEQFHQGATTASCTRRGPRIVDHFEISIHQDSPFLEEFTFPS